MAIASLGAITAALPSVSFLGCATNRFQHSRFGSSHPTAMLYKGESIPRLTEAERSSLPPELRSLPTLIDVVKGPKEIIAALSSSAKVPLHLTLVSEKPLPPRVMEMLPQKFTLVTPEVVFTAFCTWNTP